MHIIIIIIVIGVSTVSAQTIYVNGISGNDSWSGEGWNTAKNTIGMHNTGPPITGIVLAILMVLGGFIATRKNQEKGIY